MGYGSGSNSGGGGGGTPGGSTTEVQYNNAGAFGGVSGVTSDGTNLTVIGEIDASGGLFRAPLDTIVDEDGDCTVQTALADFSHGILKYYSGEILGVVAMPFGEFTTPVDGQVVTYNATNDEFELTTPAGGGNVSKVGTPANNQVGVWTGDGTIEGDTALTFDTTTDTLAIAASGNLAFGAVTVLDDSAGTTTLQNIDAIDATTEATLEAALELDSLQGNLGVGHLNSGTSASSTTFWRGDGTWATPAGGGNVTKVGTPANNQVGVWTGDGTLEGDTDLTFDTATNTLTVGGPVVASSFSTSGSGAGSVVLTEGTAPSLTANAVSHYAATDVPAGGVAWVWGGEAAATGFMLATNAAGVMTVTHIASTGSGDVARATSPTFVTPLLGTPTSGTLTNCTGLPVSTGISGLGTGVATFLATPSSANLATAVTGETGSGALVFGTSPTITTPTINTPIMTVSGALGSDDTYSGMAIDGLNAGATIAQWEAVYLGGSSKWLLADANGTNTYPAQGLAVAAYVDTNAAIVLVQGTVRNDAWNWTIGGPIYLSTTAGGLTQTAPSTSGDKVQRVGYALTADIAYFDFNSTYLTVT